MIKYLIDLLKEVKRIVSYNPVYSFKGSKINIQVFSDIKKKLSLSKSDFDGGSFTQSINKDLVVNWVIESGIKVVKKVYTKSYVLIVGLNNFILKSFSKTIKDIRFNKENGEIVKMNFFKHYFINFINFKTEKASLSIEGLNIKEMFNKKSLAELNHDEWSLLEINTKI